MTRRYLDFTAAVFLAASAHAQTPEQVVAIFRESCLPCHAGGQRAGKLQLDSVAGIADGGASGAAILPGNSRDSILYKRVTASDPGQRMPPTGEPLAPEKIEIIRRWIDTAAGAPARVARTVDFAHDVEPVLRASCYSCHSGPRAKSQLRLDTRVTALAGGIGGKVIVAGNSDASRLVHRLEGRDGEPRMPLGRAPLKPEQIAALRAWIDAGAEWPVRSPEPAADALLEKHWAYRKPVRPAVPAVRGAVANPIDNFVLAKLEQQGLHFSPAAAREKLIRRVSLDLIGLPPSPREVAEFAADNRPDSYERLVDRLLASPHYGERWARPWLDYARYADTNGYEADFRRTMWKYRDWVINALNRDLPFDQFTIEQLAGDMLPGATIDQKIATGFHRNTMLNEEGGVDRDEAYFEVLVDRTNTTGTVWLGSTMGCAQCHNHKYDPFTQKQYYQLMAFFNNGVKKPIPHGIGSKYEEPALDLPTPEQEAQRTVLKDRITVLEEKLKTGTPELEQAQAEWERETLRSVADWTTVTADRLDASAGVKLAQAADGIIRATGENPRSTTYKLDTRSRLAKITGLRIEAIPHSELPRGGPGRDTYGNFLLTRVALDVNNGSGWRRATWARKIADDGRIDDTRRKQLWMVDASRDERRVARQLVLALDCPVELKPGAQIQISLEQTSELVGQGIGQFRVSLTGGEDPVRIVKIRAKLRPLLDRPAEARTPEERKQLAEFYRTVAPSLEADREELDKLRKELKDLNIVTALVMAESPDVQRPFDYVRMRGAFSAKAARVEAGVPVVLGELPPGEPPNRLTLARWLVSRDNPLTARVAVNRLWEQYFGRGIVETSEDFGSQGERPSHPELLDWLAVEFMDRGWSMKAMHRLIVTSMAYRQSSAVTPELLKLDPYDRLISRGPRVRVEAEMVRDIALAASGLLVDKIGGPSVFPPQPPGIWDLPYNDDQWEESTGPDKYRRGLYTFARRSAPYPAMVNFDATSRESCTVRRTRTTTPLQALTTLNDRAFFEAAQALGRRMVAEGGGTDRERIAYGFRLCVARAPKPAETDRLLEYLNGERKKLGDEPAWAMLGNVLLNLDETLTKE